MHRPTNSIMTCWCVRVRVCWCCHGRLLALGRNPICSVGVGYSRGSGQTLHASSPYH